MADTPDKGYVVPSEARSSGSTLGAARRRAASQRGVRLARLHPAPGDPGRGDELQPVRDAERRGQALVDPAVLADPAIFPPTRRSRSSKAPGHSASTQRIDIWEEFKSKIGG
jgi:hypothetical protein